MEVGNRYIVGNTTNDDSDRRPAERMQNHSVFSKPRMQRLIMRRLIAIITLTCVAVCQAADAADSTSQSDQTKRATKRGRAFLVSLLDTELNLLPEFRGHSVHWLYHDNYLAAKVLAKSHPEIAAKIKQAIIDRGERKSGKIEILFGEAEQPLPFRQYRLVEVVRVDGKVIRTERVTDRQQQGWESYADLRLLASIALAAENRKKANAQFQAALEMWDGTGFADPAMKEHKRYATYKLALAVIAAKRLGKAQMLPKGLEERMLNMQSESGGWITDYKPDGTPIGKANVETSCLAILAIDDEHPPEHFQVTATTDAEIRPFFPKQVDVFGIFVYATERTNDEKILHAANLLAQYLDNDEDGIADNPSVLKSLKKARGAIMMTASEREMERMFDRVSDKVFDRRILQGLYGAETHPDGAQRNVFDAALEEVLHLVTNAGYANAYPEVFGERPGTALAAAMDKARGGQFKKVPRRYPDSAWYSYYDKSCDYGCQCTEYIYWGLTSLLGAQDFPGRGEAIADEWRLNTPEKLREGDPDLTALLTDPKYTFPKKLPNGRYHPVKKREAK